MIKETYLFVESKYAESFYDHAKSQQKLVLNRQKFENPIKVQQLNQKSIDLSSCKVTTNTRINNLASATT